MTGNYVWLSTAMSDGRHLRPLTHNFSESEEGMTHARVCRRRNYAGESLNADCFPEMIFPSEYAKTAYKSLPDIFFAGSFWVVSSCSAAVLRRFDIGGGGLFPVKVMQKDKTTPIGNNEWFCINFGNVKRAFIPEKSLNIRPFVGDTWHRKGVFGDNDAAVSPAALAGPEIWIDPLFDEGVFLSAALGDALKKAKCASGWGLKKCRLVEG
jgi:hypothetical protein